MRKYRTISVIIVILHLEKSATAARALLHSQLLFLKFSLFIIRFFR